MFLFLFIFIIGLFFGSFLNVLIDRIPRDESFVTGRSYCEECKKELAWYDLIPVASYVILKGKCRYCHAHLSRQYILLEIITGILFLQTAISLSQGNALFFFQDISHLLFLFFSLIIVSSMIVTFFIDLKEKIIPFVVILPVIFITGTWVFFTEPVLFVNHLLAAISAGLFFFLIFAISQGRGMGFGDVVFAFFMGLLLGAPSIIIGLYIAFLTGAAVSLILILSRRKKFHGSTIAFGPFLVFGLYISYFWSPIILDKIRPIFGI